MAKFRGGRGGPMGGGFNPNQMMGQIQKLQKQMTEAQEQLGNETVTTSAGGGMITLTMTGHQKVVAISIKPEVVNAADVEMLQDLIVAAVNDAVEQSRKMAEAKLGPLTGGLSIPGLM